MFHAYSIEEMYNFITGTGNNCAVTTTTTNNFPSVISHSQTQTVPHSTPFLLTCIATDADGDSLLTYSWEQMDGGSVTTDPPVSTATGGPMFKTFLPSTSPTRYFPNINDLVNNVSPTWEVIPTVGRSMNFRLIVRDNNAGAGCNDHADITLTVAGSSGPFEVMYPNATGISWNGFTSETVTWDVSGTDVSPVSCSAVDILLSTDGGLTYTDTLAVAVPNNGSYSVTVPNVSTTTARIMIIGSGRSFFDISDNDFSIALGSINLTCFGSVVNASCNGGNDGSASVQALGGTAPYTYVWSNGGTTETISNIMAGTYTVTVFDNAGADTMCVMSITEPSAIVVSSVTTDASCGVGNDGIATLTVTGGTPITTLSTDTLFDENFEDTVANGFTQQTLATDGGWLLGTSTDLSSANWSIPAHGIFAATNDDECNCDKAAEYFILPPQNFDSAGTITLTTEIFFEGNTYQGATEVGSIVASVDSGLTWTTLTTVTGVSNWQTVNTDLTSYSGMSNVWIAYKFEDDGGWLYGYAIDDVVITAQPSSPIPYTYLWSNGHTESSATNLSAGNYTITVTDNNSCTAVHTLSINAPGSMNITVSKSNVNCFGGSDGTATIAVSGGTAPYSYSWNTQPVQTTTFINNLNAAVYVATVTDASGCTLTGDVDVRIPDELVTFYIPNHPDSAGASDGDVNLLVTGGIAPYTHLWSNGESTEDINNLTAGVYLCTTTDRNGCAILTTAMLIDPPPFAPIGSISKTTLVDDNTLLVYPNPVSDLLMIQFDGTKDVNYSISILNAKGQSVLEQTNLRFDSFNNTESIDVSALEKGIYVIMIKGINTNKAIRINKL
ncbi:MAG: T9SS type A sorting domain-containing protein [Bacteroidia bacterium]|nr:T9SS type A sorting domain-containing protein [Bacteroidia bacterium]